MNSLIFLLSMFITCDISNSPTTGFKKLDRFIQRIERRHSRKIKRSTNEKTYDTIDHLNDRRNKQG
jgi:hypothetical protein